MNERSADEAVPIVFGEKLASSQAFAALFRDGMGLVEETAAYLDGPGRQEIQEARAQRGALAYATESMRLTTRLMQLASWLLLHRAVKEGEMSLAQANKEKTKVKLAAGEPGDPETIKVLPERLRVLIDRSKKLNDQVRRLDANIYAPPLAPDKPQGSNPVVRQLGPAQGRLRAGRALSAQPIASSSACCLALASAPAGTNGWPGRGGVSTLVRSSPR